MNKYHQNVFLYYLWNFWEAILREFITIYFFLTFKLPQDLDAIGGFAILRSLM